MGEARAKEREKGKKKREEGAKKEAKPRTEKELGVEGERSIKEGSAALP